MNKQTGNVYDYILQLCTADSGKFVVPFITGDEVYATNSFMAVSFAKDLLITEYAEIPDTDISSVFILSDEPIFELFVDTNEILGILSKYGMYLNNRRDCSECHGDGDSECFHCGHMMHCDMCDGTGEVGNKDPLKSFSFKDQKITICDVQFATKYIHTIALVASILGVEVMTIKYNLKVGKAWVVLRDEVRFVIMLVK